MNALQLCKSAPRNVLLKMHLNPCGYAYPRAAWPLEKWTLSTPESLESASKCRNTGTAIQHAAVLTERILLFMQA